MRTILALAALVLAGCATPSLTPDAVPTGPTRIPWGIESCSFMIAAVPVDEEALAAYLPEGFTVSVGRLGILPAGRRATIELDVYSCTGGAWKDANVERMHYGSYYAAVEPPEELREEGYDAYFLKMDFLVENATVRETLVAGGLPARGGEAATFIERTIWFADAQLTYDDGSGYRITGQMQPAQPQAEPLPFMEFTPLADGAGLARWHARLHDAEIGSGAGVVELTGSSWVRDLVGADRAPVTFIAGTWNLDEADVTFPIEWPSG